MENNISMSVEQLHQRMKTGNVSILDVRNEMDYGNWKIEGATVESENIPYFEFVEENEAAYAHLSKEKEWIVVCAKGGSSLYVTEKLRELGYQAYSLDGGMLAWSQLFVPNIVHEDEKLTLIQINRYSKGCLSYAIISQGVGMILDPSWKIEEYLKLADQQQFRIEHVVDSHLHADHITGGGALAKEVGALYYIASEEAKGTQLQFEPLEQHQHIQVGAVDVEVLAIPTPGHTPGSTSFLIDGRFLLSGDTVFVGGLGRPDLGGKAKEWADDLYDTVFHKLDQIEDQCLVLPAHYATMEEMDERGIVAAPFGDIRNRNEIMKNEDRTSFTEQVASAATQEKPPNFEEIVAINRGEMQVDEAKMIELEIGPNRCAVHHMA